MGGVCVTDADEVVELACAIGSAPSARPVRPAHAREHDDLQGDDLLVYEALSPRAARSAPQLAHAAGITARQVRSALGRLSLLGLVAASAGKDGDHLWQRVRTSPQ
jgi:DNA processing protein